MQLSLPKSVRPWMSCLDHVRQMDSVSGTDVIDYDCTNYGLSLYSPRSINSMRVNRFVLSEPLF